ncbi:hypothetical protein V6N13_138082 [Hibiscus sabdariffa]
MLRLCSRWSGIDCMVALDSPDDGSFISEQGALHGAIMPVGLNGFWPSWGDIGVGWFLWCIPLVACLLSDDGAPQEPSVLPLGVLLTVCGHCGPVRDHGCSVSLPDTGKGGSDLGSGCNVNLGACKAKHMHIWCGHKTSTEPELLVATLVHTISQDGNGSRCWLNVYITRLGSHRIDQDRGAMSKHPDRVNAGQSVTEGAV